MNDAANIASQILHTAANTPSIRTFGARLSYLADVHQAYNDTYCGGELTWDEFSSFIADAHQDGLVELQRADLVTAMDRALVDASQVSRETETWHFLTIS